MEQRRDVEARLANYNIPLQILQTVAEQCDSTIDTSKTRKEIGTRPRLPLLLAKLNDRAIVLLQQIFLDCHDSHSSFRFTVFLSSRYSPVTYKFVMDGKVRGKSNSEYTFDVCIYGRQTGNLVAVGMQNKDTKQQWADSKSLSRFLTTIEDISSQHPHLQSAYYSSSYGYQPLSQAQKNMIRKRRLGNKVEVKFFEYRDKMYVENRSLSNLEPIISSSNW